MKNQNKRLYILDTQSGIGQLSEVEVRKKIYNVPKLQKKYQSKNFSFLLCHFYSASWGSFGTGHR